MTLSGKRVAQIKIKSEGDVFHELWKANPHKVTEASPTCIQNCQVHEGELGTVGSILFWNYIHDDKERVAKTLIHDIDEEKKSVSFKILEGDLLELYKTFEIKVHVDTNGSDNLVTWTVEYEKLSPNVPDPDTLMDFYTKLTKDIETHHFKN
ncbi:kirola-like protein [Tanacetum coccineum]